MVLYRRFCWDIGSDRDMYGRYFGEIWIFGKSLVEIYLVEIYFVEIYRTYSVKLW